MTTYIKLNTLEYPRFEGDIRLEYPEIDVTLTGDHFPCPDSYAKVKWVDYPDFNIYVQQCRELPPVQINGEWTMVWAVRDLTDEEKEDLQIRRGLGSNLNVERL